MLNCNISYFSLLKYVDFSKGDDSGYLRFEESYAAEKARALAALSDEGGLIMKRHIVTLEPVTGKNFSFDQFFLGFLSNKVTNSPCKLMPSYCTFWLCSLFVTI